MTIWDISKEKAREYKTMFDSGPDSLMAKWRLTKSCAKRKPGGIPLEAWIYLAGPIGKLTHVAVVKKVVEKKKALPASAHGVRFVLAERIASKGGHHSLKPAPLPLTSKTTTDIAAQCLQMLVDEGYEETHAANLVKDCQLLCTWYSNRESAVRRLTLPGQPTNRFTSFTKWLTAMKEWHPMKHSSS